MKTIINDASCPFCREPLVVRDGQVTCINECSLLARVDDWDAPTRALIESATEQQRKLDDEREQQVKALRQEIISLRIQNATMSEALNLAPSQMERITAFIEQLPDMLRDGTGERVAE